MMFGIFKEYIEKRINLIKINAMEQSAKISGLIFFFAIVLVVSMFFLAFLILSIGMLVGSLLGSYAYGFLLMSLRSRGTGGADGARSTGIPDGTACQYTTSDPVSRRFPRGRSRGCGRRTSCRSSRIPSHSRC